MIPAGIILAAGESRRMGMPKALLPLEGRTFIDVICGRMREAGLNRVVAVIGADRDRVRAQVHPEKIEWIVNEEYQRGQLSSLWCGLEAVGEEAGVLLTLVDHPLVKVETYRGLVSELNRDPRSIVVPVIEGRRGHPIAFARAHFERFLRAPLDVGARWVLGRGEAPVREVVVTDPGIRADIDRPDEYDRWIGESGESWRESDHAGDGSES